MKKSDKEAYQRELVELTRRAEHLRDQLRYENDAERLRLNEELEENRARIKVVRRMLNV